MTGANGTTNGKAPTNGAINNPNENLQIPAWINAEYFHEILKKDEPEYVKVKKFKTVAAIPPGENFTSIMLRVHIEFELKTGDTKNKSYVLKTMLDADKGGDLINELNLFPKELDMYGKYLPAFEELYKAAGQQIQLGPRCLFTEQKDGRINFVLEDLTLKNFENAERLDGLNMVQMQRSLQKLAEFHAASVVYAEQNGPYPKYFHYGFVEKETGKEKTREQFEARVKAFKDAMLLWDMPDSEKYLKKFPTFEQYWKCILRTFEPTASGFNVLNHGDFWSSNLMMNYTKDGAIDELLLVDFQICKWGSPAEDLLFFITISAAKDIRIKEFEHFIEIYHERLVECLKLLKYAGKIPKLREMQMEMYAENASFYAFFAIFNHLVLVLFPSDKDSNLDILMRNDEEGDKYRMRTLTNPRYVAAVKDIFPFYARRGVYSFADYDEYDSE